MTPRTPSTEAGRDAVRMRGLFGGETEARASEWVLRIEDEVRVIESDAALDRIRELRLTNDLLGKEAREDRAALAEARAPLEAEHDECVRTVGHAFGCPRSRGEMATQREARAPLDVERLAEALHRAVVTGYGESACGGAGGMDDPLVFHLGEARAIAREYAALEEPTP